MTVFNEYEIVTVKKSRGCQECGGRILKGNISILIKGSMGRKFPLSLCVPCGKKLLEAQTVKIKEMIAAVKGQPSAVVPSSRALSMSKEQIVLLSDSEVSARIEKLLNEYHTDRYGYRSEIGRLIYGRKYNPVIAEKIFALKDTAAILVAGFTGVPTKIRLKIFKHLIRIAYSPFYKYIRSKTFNTSDMLCIGSKGLLKWLSKLPAAERNRLFLPKPTAQDVSRACAALSIAEPGVTKNRIEYIFAK